jgi:hypothetical protein
LKLLILIALFLVSCASREDESNVKADAPPFFKRYKKRNKELLYIAVKEKGTLTRPPRR